ncbi:hypothetical protein HanRHA438_Chr04g0151871 [Helianthus annuus]|nr:hypothetical protein HanRHA438_Chr04g0151871 [Helianthus annuus]
MLCMFVRSPRGLRPQEGQAVGPSPLGGSRHTEAPKLPSAVSCKGPCHQSTPCLLPYLCFQPSCLELLLPSGQVLPT